MTAFAAGKIDTEWGELSIEIRSLNHRYLEAFVRLPEELRATEPQVREALTDRLSRGKVDVSVRFRRDAGAASSQLNLNSNLARQLSELSQQAAAELPQAQPSSMLEWLRWPGIVEESEPDLSPLKDAFESLLNTAIDDLLAFRQREGERLTALIEDRLAGIDDEVEKVRQWLPEIREAQRTRLNDKIGQLAQSLDPERLEQEVAILLQKLDVDEELDRLIAHLAEVRRTLGLDKPVGRRLDFLMQELNREANTLGSKSVDSRTTQVSVDLKVLIEQMREQVQNIE
jgi:uncharacterized protein (TIGR00255 family)